MEPMTALVFAFQLLALFSIAGALLIYLICKVRDENAAPPTVETPQRTIVLVTSADTAFGLQLCMHLANKGSLVFAGMKDAHDSLPAKLLSNWLKAREDNEEQQLRGAIIPIQCDVTREDMLREATVSIGAHLNAGERGITAVINTSGSIYRGHVATQEVHQWEHMLKTNILGSLRVAKAFVGYLRPTHGRLIYLGAGSASGYGLVAFNATRVAVEKCAQELRKELEVYGVRVIALDTSGLPAESLYKAPVPQTNSASDNAPTQYTVDVLCASSLQVIERAIFDATPQKRYYLSGPSSRFSFLLPCRSSPAKSDDCAGCSVQRV